LSAIPAHLASALKQRQNDSEKLIGWVQLLMVSLWALLYSLSPKAFPDDAMIVPVPWILAAYMAFTVIRLLLAYAGRLGPVVLVLSVALDIALLIALVLLFHVQYMQPPAFSLKVPTMIYLFVFIALRALRFELSYLLLAGAFACIGWLLLVGYALMYSPPDAGVTRDFVQYMTGNHILLGAEIDKVFTIIAFTAILALAIARARATMISSIHSLDTASNLSRFAPAEVVRSIETGGGSAAEQPQTRVASMLFVDIEGFTTMGEQMSPEDLIASLNEYFALVVQPIEQYSGNVTQFQGDAILASFNLPGEDPDHAEHAVQAGLGILRALQYHRFSGDRQFVARVGISTGNATGGLVGVTDRVSYTVHGDAVNLAARLEQLNKQTGTKILVSHATWQALPAASRRMLSLLRETRIRGRRSSEAVYTVARPKRP